MVTTPGNRLLGLRWQEPTNSATLGVTSYDLRYAPTDASDLDDENSWTVVEDIWTTGGGALSYVLDGLTNDETYYLQVRAVNALGPGPWPPHDHLSQSATGTPAVSTALDARLSAITVNGTTIPDLAADRGTYTVGVASSVTTATVIGTPEDSGATVRCLDDTDLITDGCQVSLTANAATDVGLTVASGKNFGNYTVTINRGRGGTFRWKASEDIYGLGPALTTSFPRGLWSDGETMWVVNNGVPKGLIAFNLQTGTRDPPKDVLSGAGLAGRQASVRGLAGHDGVILVADSHPVGFAPPAQVFGYTENSNGNWRHSSGHDLVGPVGSLGVVGRNLHGIWADGEVLWAANGTGNIRAYHRIGSNKNQRLEAEDFPTASGLRGLWSDGETMWAARSQAIDAFDMVTKQPVASKRFSGEDLRVAGQDQVRWGIWSDGSTMWTAGNESIHSFEMPVSDNAELRHFRIDGTDAAGFDRELSAQTLGVPNDTATVTIDARPRHFQARYNITSTDDVTGTPGHQIDLSGGAKTFTATVTAQDTNTTKTYSIEIGRVPALTVGASVTPGPRSLTVGWSAPSDPGASPVTSYDLRYAPATAGRLWLESQWTEVDSVWQTGDGHLAHVLSDLDPRNEYYVQVRADNGIGPGPWIPHPRIGESGRGTPQPVGSDDSSLNDLSVSPATLAPAFAATTTSYTAQVARSVRQVTVTASPTDSNAEFAVLGGSDQTALTDADLNESGFQVDVGSGAYTITVMVTAENLVTTTDYTINITRAAADTDANLSALSLNANDLDALLGFSTDTLSYTFDVPNANAQITVTATARSSAAEVAFLDGASGTTALTDAEEDIDGFQVDLVGGTQKVFRVVVTAESGAKKTYTLRITRAQPLVGVVVVPDTDIDGNEIPYAEGGVLLFTVSADAEVTSELVVAYTVTGDVVSGSQSGTARILRGQDSVRVAVSTDNNTLYEDHHQVTLTISEPDGGAYGFQANKRSVTVEVRDNDFPDISSAVLILEVEEDTVTEGDDAEVTIRIELGTGNRPPHQDAPSVRLVTVPISATEDTDYEGIDMLFSVPQRNFEEGDSALWGRTLVGTLTVTIPILWDPDAEDAEQFRVRITQHPGYLDIDLQPQTITIAASVAASTETALGSLTASPATLAPAFDSATTSYTASVAHTVTQVTLAASPSDPDAYLVEYLDSSAVAVVDADGNDGNGLQAALVAGDNMFKVKVTAEDRSTTEVYTVTITQQLSDVATLSTLVIRDSASTGTFSRTLSTSCSTCAYAVPVAADVEQLTITPTPTDADATVSYHRGDTELTDADTSTADTFEVDLDEGDNVIDVRVTAPDDNATKSHTLTVTRASNKPVAGVAAPAGTPVEGATLSFTVTLSRTSQDDIVVGLSTSETGDMILTRPTSVTIAAGQRSANLLVATSNDTGWEEHSDITLSIDESRNDDYLVSGSAGSATKTVNDDDFPQSDAVLALSESVVDEGGRVTATVTVTTQGDEQPHTASGYMMVSTGDGTGANGAVSPGDFTAVSQRFNLAVNRFQREDVDDDPVEEDFRWRAVWELPISTVNDTAPEPAETFDVLLSTDDTSAHADKLTVSGSPATATIRTSDFPEVRISSQSSAETEGATITYTVTRTGSTTLPVTVNLTVTEDGDMVAASAEGSRSVTIAANESSANFTLSTQDDTAWEEHSIITASIADGVGYIYREATGSTAQTIRDDDFPAATATLAVSERQPDEGDTVTVTLTVTTSANRVPHRGTGLLQVAAASGTAAAGLDFAALDELVEFAAADFEEVDVDDTVSGEDLRGQATTQWQITITDDTVGELAETFTVALSSVSGGSNPTAENIAVQPSDPARLEITINPSDLPVVSITSGSGDVVEGDGIEFTVARSYTTTQALTVNVAVTQTSTLAAPGQTGSRQVTIGAGQPSAIFTVTTATDTEWDAHGAVTAAVATGDGYTPSPTQRIATRHVKDNDFPDASLTLTGIPDPVEEGHNAQIQYVFLTGDDQQPHKPTGEFTLSITGDTAVVGPPGAGVDVTAFEPATFSVDAGDFTRVDIDDDPVDEDWRWRAAANTGRRLIVADDNDEEDAEQFSVALAPVASADTDNPGDANIAVTSPGVVEIDASDLSDASEDATLSGLALSTANTSPPLSPAFAAGTTAYTASVPFGETQLTITPTANHADATVRYRVGTGGSLTAVTGGSFQVSLAEGPNVIEIHVAAEDPRYTQTYTVTATREPQVSIAVATTAAVTEGGDVTFTVTRSRVTDSDLEVALTVTDAGDVLDAAEEGAQEVTIPTSQASADYTVTTRDNTGYSTTASVTVDVVDGDGYTASTTSGRATKDIRDDDFPGRGDLPGRGPHRGRGGRVDNGHGHGADRHVPYAAQWRERRRGRVESLRQRDVDAWNRLHVHRARVAVQPGRLQPGGHRSRNLPGLPLRGHQDGDDHDHRRHR